MRARLALAVSGRRCELREVVLRNKPQALLQASPKATVPVLVLPDGVVVEQSLDIMLWALRMHDPEGWLAPEEGSLAEMLCLIQECDERFKPKLDRYKYPGRFVAEFVQQRVTSSMTPVALDKTQASFHPSTEAAPDDAQEPRHPSKEVAPIVDEAALSAWAVTQRDAGGAWLASLEARLAKSAWLFGPRRALADMAIAPFVRQYAHVDKEWFDAQPWPGLQAWLSTWMESQLFAAVMTKYRPWAPDTTGELFP